jgi:mRNA-degrading endonuclease toxin of MazEF toxin-antitoxin module
MRYYQSVPHKDPLHKVKLEIGRVIEFWLPLNDDPRKHKSRPCVVLNDDEDNLQVCFCPCTSEVHRLKEYPFSFIVKAKSDEGLEMNLKKDSILVIERISSIDKNIVGKDYRLFGKAPDAIISRILLAKDACERKKR